MNWNRSKRNAMHETQIQTGNETWDSFVPTIKWFLSQDKSHFTIEGREVSGYRSPDTNPIWLRDHTHQMKGFRYFEPDMTSSMDIFRQYQMPDGAFYDFFVYSEQPCEPGEEVPKIGDRFHFDDVNKIQFARCGVEADVEYLAVEAVYKAWQATGDDEWMRGMLESLERGLTYSLTDSSRWSEEHQLVKRPFTIDTWDFEFGSFEIVDGRRTHSSNIRGENYWCIMHGDNTGMANSCRLLARLFDHSGDSQRAARWTRWAEHFVRRTNEVCWNGRFYTHQVHITPVDVPADESEQLSLSNTYDMNRGVPSHEQCASIIREYMRRRETRQGEHLAEWYGIDPAFPNFAFGHDFAPGEYVNGGIMPLVGGELARAAFEHGFEGYGVDILRHYCELAVRPRETYLWYRPDGSHWSGGSFLATDGWGSAAMLNALLEGLAGIEDESKLFGSTKLSPRWAAAGETQARVTACYPASDAYFRYEYEQSNSEIAISTEGSGSGVRFHVLLPEGASVSSVSVDGGSAEYGISRVESSRYVDFSGRIRGRARIALV